MDGNWEHRLIIDTFSDLHFEKGARVFQVVVDSECRNHVR